MDNLKPSYCKRCSNIEEGLLVFHKIAGECAKEECSYYIHQIGYCPMCGKKLYKEE